MKDMRYGIHPFRSAEMGALGLGIGQLIVLLGSKYVYLDFPKWWHQADLGILLNVLRDGIPSALTSALASALLGLMLCLSISVSRQIILRACFIMAGLGVVATLIGDVILRLTPYQSFFNPFYDGSWQNIAVALESSILAMINGLFTGAGLGLAIGGWKSCWHFALKGTLAYGLGFVIGGVIYQLWISSGWWIGNTTYLVSIISLCICGILAGGILGWLWGKERGNESIRVVESNPVSSRV